MEKPEVTCLDQVRRNIDCIDRQVIKLLAERQFNVTQAARFKRTDGEVKAPARVDEVISKIRTISMEYGLDADIAENVYRTMISGFIEKELKEFKKNI